MKTYLFNRILLIVHCSMFIIHCGYTQVNLVVNPSFEEIHDCPTNHSQLFLATGWDTLRNGGGGTLDLFHKCCSSNVCGVPANFNGYGYQYPKSGSGYAGIITTMATTLGGREYMQSQLIKKLEVNTSYCVKMYVSLSKYGQYSCTSLGIYLDDGMIQSINYQPPFPYIVPQVVNTGQQLNNTLNWMKIEGSFIANGTEEYITIGNFFPDELSGIAYSYPNAPLKGSYYYIDDVSVIDITTPAYAGQDTLINLGDSVFIGRQPEIGLNDACVWSVNGVPTDTIAGKWVSPTETTTYVLEQTLCGNVQMDSVTITVNTANTTNLTISSSPLKLYPNPTKTHLTLDHPTLQTPAQVHITDVLGNLVYYNNHFTTTETIDVVNFSKGIYFVQLKTENKIYSAKFVKE